MDGHFSWWVVLGFVCAGALVLTEAHYRDQRAKERRMREAADRLSRDWMEALREDRLRTMQAGRRLLTQGRRYRPAADHLAPAKLGMVLPLRKRA